MLPAPVPAHGISLPVQIPEATSKFSVVTAGQRLLRVVVPVAAGFAAGAVPFSNLMAKRRAGVDLRDVGNGTVSGTGLSQVAGAGPVVVVGLFELAKGALGPLLAGRSHPYVRAVAGAAAVTGHNWSPALKGAGGRGISPAMGAMLVSGPAGTLVLLAGLVVGKLLGETAVGCLASDILLVPVVKRAHGRDAALAAGALLLPVLAKRLAGNAAPAAPSLSVFGNRLVFDRDTVAKAVPSPGPRSGR